MGILARNGSSYVVLFAVRHVLQSNTGYGEEHWIFELSILNEAKCFQIYLGRHKGSSSNFASKISEFKRTN